jgi:hypothetical protein
VHADSHSRTIRHKAKQSTKPKKPTAFRFAFKHNLAEGKTIPEPAKPSARRFAFTHNPAQGNRRKRKQGAEESKKFSAKCKSIANRYKV